MLRATQRSTRATRAACGRGGRLARRSALSGMCATSKLRSIDRYHYYLQAMLGAQSFYCTCWRRERGCRKHDVLRVHAEGLSIPITLDDKGRGAKLVFSTCTCCVHPLMTARALSTSAVCQRRRGVISRARSSRRSPTLRARAWGAPTLLRRQKNSTHQPLTILQSLAYQKRQASGGAFQVPGCRHSSEPISLRAAAASVDRCARRGILTGVQRTLHQNRSMAPAALGGMAASRLTDAPTAYVVRSRFMRRGGGAARRSCCV